MRVFRVFFTAVLMAGVVAAASAAQSQTENSNQSKDDPVVPARATVKKAKIKSKPAPSYPEEARLYNADALIRLRVILRASGAVTDINATKVALSKGAPKELADAFIREARSAAEKIKFEPAEMNGQAVSQYVILEYAFNNR